MKKKSTAALTVFITFILLAAACKTTPVVIPDDMNPAEFFQKAQEASNNGKYDTALTYYNTFLERYPDDLQRRIEAEYEIAFIAYKRNDTEKAKQLFTELIDKYKSDASQILPAWPRIMSEKILKEIEGK